MELDDELCLCFHVSKRKVVNYIRSNRPTVASQLSECLGAGTGCGWCRTYLRALHAEMTGGGERAIELSADDHARGRSVYVRAGRGTPPPGATPIA